MSPPGLGYQNVRILACMVVRTETGGRLPEKAVILIFR